MVEKRVVWTDKARINFKTTLHFYRERNGSEEYSTQLYQDIVQSIELLRKNEHLGKSTDEENVRVLTKGHFRIFYEQKTEEIVILVIWDSRRDPSELKKYMLH